ncbi:MAG: ABC transporter substrate-binding protein [Deltaproteobacteria bacterium]|nr:ABC transporter substrate-binding protein [Deltaproteobacteria bacterium]
MRISRLLATYRVPVVVLCFGILGVSVLARDSGAQTIKMTVGQAGVNPGTSLYFIAQKENLFQKHGLDVKVISTTTSSAVQAMLGGSMQLTTGSAGAAFITATLQGAPPFVLVSSWINVFPYTIVARKEISKVQDLKGKTGQVGATFGTAPDVALRFGLAKVGIDPEKDVKLVQMPRPDWLNVMAQIEKGEVQFAVLPPPYDRLGEKRGFRALIALPDLGLSFQQNGEWVLKSYLGSNREAVVRWLRVISDATQVYFNQKEKTLAYLTEFLGTKDPSDTEYAYQTYLKWADKTPIPRLEPLRSTLDAIKRTTPKAATADPASFMDTSLMEQLIKEGYFK